MKSDKNTGWLYKAKVKFLIVDFSFDHYIILKWNQN